MVYRINEVASMLGISPQTLRFYEQYGVMLHERVGDGNYRQYGDDSIDVLMTLRKYRNCGFTVAQTAKIVMEQNTAKTAEILEQQAKELLRQAEMNNRIAARMQENAKQIHLLAGETRAFEPCRRKQMYMIPVRESTEKNLSASVMKQIGDIVAWLPLLKWVTWFDKGKKSESNGFVIQEEDAVFLGIDQWKNTIELPEAMCFKCVAQWSTGTLSNEVEKARNSIESTGERISDAAVAVTTGNYHNGEKTVSYGEIWVERKTEMHF